LEGFCVRPCRVSEFPKIDKGNPSRSPKRDERQIDDELRTFWSRLRQAVPSVRVFLLLPSPSDIDHRRKGLTRTGYMEDTEENL
jgi:hypothetical protein